MRSTRWDLEGYLGTGSRKGRWREPLPLDSGAVVGKTHTCISSEKVYLDITKPSQNDTFCQSGISSCASFFLLCLDSTCIQSTGSAFFLVIVWLSLRRPRSIISEGKDGFVRNGLLCAFNGSNKTPASLFFKSLCYLMAY